MASIKVGKFFVEMSYKSDPKSLNALTNDTSKALGKAHKQNQSFMRRNIKDFAAKLGGIAKSGGILAGGGLLAGGLAFLNSMKEASNVADDILTTATQIGVSAEMAQKLQFAGIQADIGKQGYLDFIKKTSKITGSLKSGKATTEEQQTAKALGITKEMSLEEVFNQIVKKAGEKGMSKEKLAFMLSKFQIRSKEALALATALPGFKKQVATAMEQGAVIQTEKNIVLGEEVSAKMETRELANSLKMLTQDNISTLDSVQAGIQKATDLLISSASTISSQLTKIEGAITNFQKNPSFSALISAIKGLSGSGRG